MINNSNLNIKCENNTEYSPAADSNNNHHCESEYHQEQSYYNQQHQNHQPQNQYYQSHQQYHQQHCQTVGQRKFNPCKQICKFEFSDNTSSEEYFGGGNNSNTIGTYLLGTIFLHSGTLVT
uniref:Uncharacterized protein n=1 Tax=Cacopsylla melanoneura TaxID=428564 RepID=A0A8D8VYC9_9HEMI